MIWIIHILLDALVLLVAAKLMSTVEIRNFSTALLTALAVGVLGFLIGWLLAGVLHLATLGLFYFTGLSFIIRIVVNGIVIEIVDQFSSGFHTKGFMPSLILAVIIAVVGAAFDAIFLG